MREWLTHGAPVQLAQQHSFTDHCFGHDVMTLHQELSGVVVVCKTINVHRIYTKKCIVAFTSSYFTTEMIHCFVLLLLHARQMCFYLLDQPLAALAPGQQSRTPQYPNFVQSLSRMQVEN